MATAETFAPGAILGNYRVGERASNNVWQGEDVRSGRRVAVKLLARQLPTEAARRDQLVRALRLGAAIYHPALVNIIEVVAVGDLALLIMEWFDAEPVSMRYRGTPADRGEFFRVAYQITDAVRTLQLKELVHGNIAGDSVLVAANGHARLAGLNLANLMPRQGGSTAFQQRGSDVNAVSYMAPEQITGQPPVSPQTDIFSLGVVFYEIATGRRPYLGVTPSEVAHKIVAEPPASPKAVFPGIDNAVLGVIGKCLFKDAYKRMKDAKSLLVEVGKGDAEALNFAQEIAKSAAPQTAAPRVEETRSSILLIGEIVNFDEVNVLDPAAAQKDAARMQQIIGEAAYLFDGQVADPFGPRCVAELPTTDAALEAARKAEFDLSPDQQGDVAMQVRLLLHAGEVETRDGSLAGAGIDRAADVLPHLPPLKLFLTEDFAKMMPRGSSTRIKDFGARGGVKLFTIQPPEPATHEATTEPSTAKIEAEEAAELAAEEAALLAKKKKKRQQTTGAVVAVLVAVIAAIAVPVLRKPKPQAAPVATSTAPAAPAQASAATPRKIVLQPFKVEATDPALTQRSDAIRLASMEALRAFPEVRIADAPASDVTPFSASIRAGAAGPEIVPADGDGRIGIAAAVPDVGSGIQAVVGYVAQELKLPPRAASVEAYNAFADAVTAISANDDAKTDAALRAAIKADPNFLAAQSLAMRFYDKKGRDADTLAAAKQVAALEPGNVDAARFVARASLKTGDVAGAIGSYGAILQNARGDAEALSTIGKYAWSAGDTAKFSSVLQRLPMVNAPLHAPDLLLAAGRIDAAIDKYYDIETRDPENAALALKIGRIAVLRHSTDIAEIELKKLEAADPKYGAHVLKAYIAAQKGDRGGAASELAAAQSASKPGDDLYTSAAEVAAIGGDAKGVVDALEKAVDRKEPTASYVLANPLFGFLQSDARFLKVRERLAAQQSEIRAALAGVAL
jgi:serine/threonine-protein kinase